MAMRILASRVSAPNNSMPLRVCVTQSCSMSSESSKKGKEVSTRPKHKKEGFLSALALLYGGKLEAADPSKPPIPAKDIKFADVTERASGEEKLYLLAFENGVLDPYCNLPVERKGRGTKDNPVPILSFEEQRCVACVCESSQTYVKYTWLYKDQPRRCSCGHWLKLVDAPKFWRKIPREDLMDIPYFLELELQGKLEPLLAGKLSEEEEKKLIFGDGHH